MSARSAHDWASLGLTEDPVPGDAIQVHEVAAALRSLAVTLADTQRALHGLDGGAQSMRVVELHEQAATLIGLLTRVRACHDAAAVALGAYGEKLSHHQRRSIELLDEARVLGGVSGADGGWGSGLDHDGLASSADLNKLQGELRLACAQRDEDARSAARAIDTAMEENGLADSVAHAAQTALGTAATWTKHHVVDDITSLGWMSTGATVLAHVSPLTHAVSPVASVGWGLTAATSIGEEFAAAQRSGNWLKFAGVTAWELLITYGHVRMVRGLKRRGVTESYRRRRAELEHGSPTTRLREELGEGSGLTKLCRLPGALWDTGMDYQFKALDGVARRIRPGDHRHVLIPAQVADHLEAEIVKSGIEQAADVVWTAAPAFAIDRIAMIVRAVGTL
ncbi:MAG: hypothetical protein V9G19_20130 [Tetrasphaera sp.]